MSADSLVTGIVPNGAGLSSRLRVVPAPEWDELMARFGTQDTYFRAAYSSMSALLEAQGTEAVLLHFKHCSGEVALPLLLRPLPDGKDATSAYGYGGPVARGEPDVALFGAALDAWARQHGIVATFLRTHPLLGNVGLIPPDAELVASGRTVAWDISPGRDLVQCMSEHHRKAARRADRAGLQLSVDDRPASMEEFRELYFTTMRRQGASPYFYFPAGFWDALVADQDTLRPVIVEGREDGVLIAALLSFAGGPWLHAHLGASADAARSIGASNRCYLAAAQWAQERGLTTFHLGGGFGEALSSSLFLFKHRFDPASEPLPYYVAKLVHDRVRYRQLAGSDSTAGFFPPWRQPG